MAVRAHNGSPRADVLKLALTLVILPMEGTSDTLSSCLGELLSILYSCMAFQAGAIIGEQFP